MAKGRGSGAGAGPGSAAREVVLRDFANNTATFIPVDEHDEESCAFKKSNVYRFKLCCVEEDEALWSVSISILCPEQWESDGILYPKTAWLTDVLLSKIVKWSTENKKSIYKSTLSLISLEKYSERYHQLKEKYKEMVKVWPEVTDPEKFVYEDVAIATYLLVLWEDERAEKDLAVKQSFIDLGCGNGLLVHILSNEGYLGRGIDVRKRKIWNMYGPQTHLEEHAITPSDSYLFPDVDWIIGNHSDELTPWIPLIAARSSYECRYFVLPCCFFDFYGKYCRRQTKKTQYREYLDFIIEVGSVCGFEVEEDCLRIPSTKRVCLLGKQRKYPPSSEGRLDEERTQYIRGRLTGGKSAANNEMTAPESLHSHDMKHFTSDIGDMMEEASLPIDSSTSSNWVGGFQPREKIEKVKNCATLPRDFIDGVVLHVANALLNANQDHQEKSNDEDKGCWNKGGSLPLKNVAGLLDRDALQRLKKECGGLKTLLRNNYQVFEVVQSNVQIRDWTKEKQTRRPASNAKRKLPSEACKTRLCWFFANHPDGCPRSTERCPFAHGTEELKPCANSKKEN